MPAGRSPGVIAAGKQDADGPDEADYFDTERSVKSAPKCANHPTTGSHRETPDSPTSINADPNRGSGP